MGKKQNGCQGASQQKENKPFQEHFYLTNGSISSMSYLQKSLIFVSKRQCLFREKNICFASLASYLLDGKLGKHVAARIFSPYTKKSMKVSAV